MTQPARTPTEALRRQHDQLRQALGRACQRLSPAAEDRRAVEPSAIATAVALGRLYRVQAEWEERVVFPFADQCVNGTEQSLTASFRRAHREIDGIVRRLEARDRCAGAAPDLEWAADEARELCRLLAQHLEAEEALLFPIIDVTTTAEAVDRLVATGKRCARAAP